MTGVMTGVMTRGDDLGDDWGYERMKGVTTGSNDRVEKFINFTIKYYAMYQSIRVKIILTMLMKQSSANVQN